MKNELLKKLPKVDELLMEAAIAPYMARYGKPAVTEAVRQAVDEIRKDLLAGGTAEPEAVQIINII